MQKSGGIAMRSLFTAVFIFSSIFNTTNVLAGSIKSWGMIIFDSNDLVGQFTIITAGGSHSLALKSNGQIIGWGYNEYGQAMPPEGNNFIAIAAGYSHSLALKSDGTIVGWGDNSSGQATPPDGNDFTAIAAGVSYSLALKSNGSIVGWGYNYDGQATPPEGNDFIAIAAGENHSLALKSDGSIVGWGDNTWGQATPPEGNDFVGIAAGEGFSFALKSNGSIVGWGYNDDGRATPPDGNDFTAIAAGEYHSIALKSDGSIVGWGDDSWGQATPPEGNDFIAIAAGENHSLALKSDGSIVGWGDNTWGQAMPPEGNDFVAIAERQGFSFALKSNGSIVGWGYNDDGKATPPEGNDFIAIAAGVSYSLALKSNGSIVGWGDNSYGKATPPEGNDFVAIAAGYDHSLALKSDGSIVGWGYNSYGELTPPEGNDFVAIAAGAGGDWYIGSGKYYRGYSLALKSDGSIIGWGDNYWGQLSIPEGNDFVAISAGLSYALAIKSDGSIIGWGNNYYGQATPPAGKYFVAVSAGSDHSLALKANGSIVGWGAGSSGQYDYPNFGQAIPPAGNNFIAIEACELFSLALMTEEPFDNSPPGVEVVMPQSKATVQDSIILTAEANDESGIDAVYFYIREPYNSSGVPIGKDDLPATFDSATGKWEYVIDTTQIPDGRHVILAKAVDKCGNERWSSVVAFSIHNWGEYLPVFGGPGYDETTGNGFKASNGDGPCAFVNIAGTAVGTMTRYVGGSSTDSRAVRWNSLSATELGNLGTNGYGHAISVAYAINDAGMSVGYAGNTDIGSSAVRWDASGTEAVELENLGWYYYGSTSTVAVAVNRLGAAVGYSRKYDYRCVSKPFGGCSWNYVDIGPRPVRWDSSGVSTELGNLGTETNPYGYTNAQANAINDSGTVVGTAAKWYSSIFIGGGSLGYRAVRWEASETTATELGNLGTSSGDNNGVTYTSAVAINDASTAVGQAEKYEGGVSKGWRAVRWDASGTAASELGYLNTDSTGDPWTVEARAINSTGTIVGVANQFQDGVDVGLRAVRWDATGTSATELGNLGTNSSTEYLGYTWGEAYAVNDNGITVGYAWKFVDDVNFVFVDRAVLWEPNGAVVELNKLIDPSSGWTLKYAYSISNTGWIAGLGEYDPDGQGGFEPYERLFTLKIPEYSLPNHSPTADAGQYQTVERTSINGAEVTLDGSDSNDPDGDALTYEWTWEGGSAVGVKPLVIFPIGSTTVTLTVSDGQLSDNNIVIITVVDTTPPEVGITIPEVNVVIQDDTILTAEANDISDVVSLCFYVREPNDGNGTPIGYENLLADFNNTSGKWEYSIDTTSLSNGDYFILVSAVDGCGNTGFSKPLLVTISNNLPQQTGNLKVTLGPAAAVSAGAKWRVDSGTWQNSETTVTDLSVGSHTVNYKSTSGWNTPADQNVTISNGLMTNASGTYTRTSPLGVTKCTVTAGGKGSSDNISFSGTMDATADEILAAGGIEVIIDSNDIAYPCDQNFPINGKTFKIKNGTYNYLGTENKLRKSFIYNVRTHKFSFSARNVDLSGLGCPLSVGIEIGDYAGVAEVNETIVNGPKVPMPIQLMTGVKNVLRVDKCQVKHGKDPNSDQLSVKGAFAVENPDVNMPNRVSEGLVITLGTQHFTIPANKLKAGKGKFTFRNAPINEGGFATGEFNFKMCSFTLTIKNTVHITATGEVDFCVKFAAFNEKMPIALPK